MGMGSGSLGGAVPGPVGGAVGGWVGGCEGGIEFTGVGAECVGERLGDPARVGVYECGMTDRVGGCIRRQLVHPRLFIAFGNRPQHAIDETRSY